MDSITGNICKLCTQIKEWKEDQDKYYKTNNEEYDYSCPCDYCSLNNIGY